MDSVQPSRAPPGDSEAHDAVEPVVRGVLAAGVGCVGGIYGIGRGSILAPILVGSGRSPTEVAPATLASTFLTSIAGVITFVILSMELSTPVSPDWGVGLALGGLLGGYTGAWLQPHLPEDHPAIAWRAGPRDWPSVCVVGSRLRTSRSPWVCRMVSSTSPVSLPHRCAASRSSTWSSAIQR
jgi:hypothetical protein